ncbi:MAG: hypothetical protein PHQ56_08750 [Dysgonamonadaceae bacterium]|jgi:hypothetical protein|nr:hypothetical protein [Dysgonamonadaceae bacterium]MDD3357248.1 hypothetical protein [Dysgonamonadaceae bacterium]
MKLDYKDRTAQLIAIIVVMALALGITAYFVFTKDKQITEMQEQYTIDKQELEDEYESISMQYEGFKFSVQNDSLLYKLENEQAKVQRLMEELRLTKATDQAEIRRLKDELSTLRKILKSYIQQIDSLNRLNEELKAENVQITKQYKETSRSLNVVSQEKKQLTEKVSLAAKLVATNVSIKAVNSRGKTQKRLSRSEQFIISFTISRNITAEPGERIIYARILQPDGSVLTKNPNNLFSYENKEIAYSSMRVIEYGGEETGVALYYDIEEFLMPGTYKVDIFADGSHIGSSTLQMED